MAVVGMNGYSSTDNRRSPSARSQRVASSAAVAAPGAAPPEVRAAARRGFRRLLLGLFPRRLLFHVAVEPAHEAPDGLQRGAQIHVFAVASAPRSR